MDELHEPRPEPQHPNDIDPYTLDKPRCTASYQGDRCTLPADHPQPVHIGPPPLWAIWSDPH